MNSEKHIILTISLLFSVVLLLTSTITVYASINNYFKDNYENQYENKVLSEKTIMKIYLVKVLRAKTHKLQKSMETYAKDMVTP